MTILPGGKVVTKVVYSAAPMEASSRCVLVTIRHRSEKILTLDSHSFTTRKAYAVAVRACVTLRLQRKLNLGGLVVFRTNPDTVNNILLGYSHL